MHLLSMALAPPYGITQSHPIIKILKVQIEQASVNPFYNSTTITVTGEVTR